ncbi:MAG: SsrA-binding protein SmpB [Deltaproteobacteria bacterium]|jgi:SsrA-binding protein|nr:SsrA-binding protein SmpB [Deltaproteobacteria bacterium]
MSRKKYEEHIEGKIIARNRKARFNYHIIESWEAGMSLLGSEVKSVRNGKINLIDAYCEVEKGEIFLVNARIAAYKYSNRQNHAPRRRRKLLLHKGQIKRIGSKVREKSYTIVPLLVYLKNNGKFKVEIALAKGKTYHDKRETIRKKDEKRLIKKGLL